MIQIDLTRFFYQFYFLLGAYCLGGEKALGFTALGLGFFLLLSVLIETFHS